ncbi:hypothetical protein GpartN1_g3556.t1 [Galdieria partita]|uniref:NECAP PHear domain-containing protein n=1 Tax=Galdieria partita TaxID=83374 RepID=A0A9C7PWE9_9RHOD|nr:hypothetical protein GpartN1_g3556.t1 [Galdieria partita]
MQRILFASREVHVYRVPQPQLVQGRFLCQEWEGEHLFTGRCRVMEEGEGQVWIRLEDRVSGELFAESPYHESGPQHAVDSSRYFVLQVKDRETQRKAFLGIGFEQRGEAFDFLAALHDSMRQREGAEQRKPASPPKDFSLKQGQKLKLSVPGMKKSSRGGGCCTVDSSEQVSTSRSNDMEDGLFRDSSGAVGASPLISEDTFSKSKPSQSCLDDLLF